MHDPIIIKDPLRHVARGQTLRVNCTVDVEKDTNYKLSWTYSQPVTQERIYITIKISTVRIN